MKLDLLVLLSAIATSEGYFTAGTVPARNANPGDLRFAGQDGSVPSADGGSMPFAKFDCEGRGIAANLRQICKNIQAGDTLRTFVYRWAPPTGPDGGNNSALYLSETIRRIKSVTGLDIDPDVKLWNYLTIQHID